MNAVDKPLKILNASAGSGKTFSLVKEYISLLLKDEKDINAFASIVAMTFTNKAAFEMKTRIIQALDLLSFPEVYTQKSHDYALLIGSELGINPEEIHERAQRGLQNILHCYEDFHIMTIDKFNLKLIRSFSKDLNISTDFEIVFNEREIIENIIDKMMSELGADDQNRLTKVVFEYAKSNIDDGERWDFRKSLLEFSEIIKNEKYNGIVEHLIESDFSFDRLKNLRFDLKRMEDHFVGECKKVYAMFLDECISVDELPGASRNFSQIQKLDTYTTFPKKDLFTDTFIDTCSKDTPLKKRFPEHLKAACLQLYSYWKKEIMSYSTLRIFLKNYYNMALLQFMAGRLNTVRKDEQMIRISEFNALISQLVKNEEAPFIYERLGTRFKHFLLDEFQDTSHLQWLNIVPLLHESISNNNRNFIVGDPKQSIYRFKNGVAEQFVALPGIYNPENDSKINLKSAFFESMGKQVQLKENWRSAPIIVQFNNLFFEELRSMLPEENKSFYASVSQIPRSQTKGFVEIVSGKVDEKEDEIVFEQLLQWIDSCEQDGFKRGDICILGEKNKECNRWAVFLNERGYDVVSADSLLVGKDKYVQLVISYLKRRFLPLSENEKRKFAEKFFKVVSQNDYIDYKSFLMEKQSKQGKKYLRFDDDRFLRSYFESPEVFFTKYENIYDLIQKFYTLMGFNELSNPYLHHLADLAHQYDLNHGPDLKGFLDYFNGEGKNSSVQLPESENAIKIMSIHKSKGLEFPVVILPNMDLSTGIKGFQRFLFEKDDFVLYTGASGSSEVDVIRDFSKTEEGLIFTDAVNKCYVAMTRPEQRLYILNKFKKGNFGEVFHAVLEVLNLDNAQDSNELKLNLGERVMATRPAEREKDLFFTPKSVKEALWFPDISLKEQKDLPEEDVLSEAQRYGNQLHLALSLINHPEEISACIESLFQSGQLEREFGDRMKLEIEELLNLSQYTDLLKDADEILNEQAIVANETQIVRPDKLIFRNDGKGKSFVIVLDFKTGMPNKRYQKQVKEYAAILSEMGYERVDAYLFYTALKRIEQVN